MTSIDEVPTLEIIINRPLDARGSTVIAIGYGQIAHIVALDGHYSFHPVNDYCQQSSDWGAGYISLGAWLLPNPEHAIRRLRAEMLMRPRATALELAASLSKLYRRSHVVCNSQPATREDTVGSTSGRPYHYLREEVVDREGRVRVSGATSEMRQASGNSAERNMTTAKPLRF